MCGRYTLAAPDPAAIRDRFPIGESIEVRQRFNVAPGDDVLAVTTDREGTPRGLSAAALHELLRSTAVPHGSAARIAALLAHRYVASLTAPSAGRLTGDWYFVPHGAHLPRATHARAPVRVATGRATAAEAGSMKIAITLTSAGRRLLRRSRRVALTARATFAPVGFAAQTATKTFTVRR